MIEHAGPGGDPALRQAQTPTDSGSSRAAASSLMLSGTGWAKAACDDDELGEGAVDRRGGEEAHVRAEVVAAGEALLADEVGHARLERDALAGLQAGHALADGYDDLAGRLVPEDQRLTRRRSRPIRPCS